MLRRSACRALQAYAEAAPCGSASELKSSLPKTSHSSQLHARQQWTRSFATASVAQSQGKGKQRQYDPLPTGWEAIIGVEVHAQLKSKRKLFSGARVVPSYLESQEAENAHVTAYDAALPGTLPSLEEQPLRLAIKAGLALECTLGDIMHFDRKQYFYPDLPGGYQITQKYAPLAKDGRLRLLFDDGHIPTKDEEVDVRIEQVQLEQDTAKSTHGTSESTGDVTLINLNRAGSALIEIVSGPDMRTPEQAGAYIRKLRSTLRHIGASDGNMEEGSLRCDVNVSVHRVGEPWGLRCEVKNLNSIKFVMNAISHEMHRQQQEITQGRTVEQETRGYNEADGTTFRLRSKEDAPDYRYMPDPNLPAYHLDTSSLVREVEASMPELADAQRARLIRQYGIGMREANVLLRIELGDEEFDGGRLSEMQDGNASDAMPSPVPYFEELAQGRDAKVALNWLIHELLKALNACGKTYAQNHVRGQNLGELIDLVQSGRVTLSSARTLLSELAASHDGGADVLQSAQSDKTEQDKPVEALLLQRNAMAMSEDVNALTTLCAAVVNDLPEEVRLVRAGKDKVVMRLVGEVMKRAQGRADARAARAELIKQIRG